MARNHATILSAIWQDPDFNALNPKAQWMYLLLLSQQDLNSCGVIAHRPKMWARFAEGISRTQVEDLVIGLHDRGFLVFDEDTDEVLIRTFMRHDGILKSPNILKSAARQFGAIHSETVKEAILRELPAQLRGYFPDKIVSMHPTAIKTLLAGMPEVAPDQGFAGSTEPLGEGFPEPLTEPFQEGFTEPLGEGLLTRTSTLHPPPSNTPTKSQDYLQPAGPDPQPGGMGNPDQNLRRVARRIGLAAADRDAPDDHGSYAAGVTRRILQDADRHADRQRIAASLATGLSDDEIVARWWDPPPPPPGSAGDPAAVAAARAQARQLEEETQARLEAMRSETPAKPTLRRSAVNAESDSAEEPDTRKAS